MKEIQLNKNFPKSKYYMMFKALVDDEDFEMLNKFSWCVQQYKDIYYACTEISTGRGRSNRKCVKMHRLIMNAEDGVLVDHRDMNGLNNQRSNLRIATHSQNCSNTKSRPNTTSNYLGVSWDKYSKKWAVQISVNLKNVKIGRFIFEKEAALAYNKAALKYHGEFARLNILT